jgi:hypothetical protein
VHPNEKRSIKKLRKMHSVQSISRHVHSLYIENIRDDPSTMAPEYHKVNSHCVIENRACVHMTRYIPQSCIV